MVTFYDLLTALLNPFCGFLCKKCVDALSDRGLLQFIHVFCC